MEPEYHSAAVMPVAASFIACCIVQAQQISRTVHAALIVVLAGQTCLSCQESPLTVLAGHGRTAS